MLWKKYQKRIVGVNCVEEPPVPIPNTEVKLCSGENTCLETSREDSSSPTLFEMGYMAPPYVPFFRIPCQGSAKPRRAPRPAPRRARRYAEPVFQRSTEPGTFLLTSSACLLMLIDWAWVAHGTCLLMLIYWAKESYSLRSYASLCPSTELRSHIRSFYSLICLLSSVGRAPDC